MLIKLNHDTAWLATGVLGTVVFAALVLAFQERQSKARQAEGDFLLSANPSAVGSVVATSSSSNGKMTTGRWSSVDHAFTESPPQEIPSSQIEPASSPETNHNDAQTNPGSGTLARRQDSARAIGHQFRNARNKSSLATRYVDVKRRLLELWHQSLAKSEKSQSWTAFSNLNRGERKKAAYTAETNH